MSNNCEIINDLLPLYIDKVISEEGKKMVETHLATCENCAKIAKEMGRELNIPMDNNSENIKELKKKYKMSIWFRVFLIAFVLVMAWIIAGLTLANRWTEIFPKAALEDIKAETEIVIIGDTYYLHTDEIFGSGVPVMLSGSEDDTECRFYLGENGIHNIGLGRSYQMGEKLYPLGTVGTVKKIIYAKPNGSDEIILFEEGDVVETLQGNLKSFEH